MKLTNSNVQTLFLRSTFRWTWWLPGCWRSTSRCCTSPSIWWRAPPSGTQMSPCTRRGRPMTNLRSRATSTWTCTPERASTITQPSSNSRATISSQTALFSTLSVPWSPISPRLELPTWNDQKRQHEIYQESYYRLLACRPKFQWIRAP